MKIVRKWLYSLFYILIPFGGFSQDLYLHDPIIITASRLSSALTTGIRELIVLSQKEIDILPVESITDLLNFLGGVDLQRRGRGVAQADFSMRGSTFEQVLILIDGVRINDPQTGHHNSDISLTLSDIQRVEILPGHSSSLYGSHGYGGMIHIITVKPDKNRFQCEFSGGSYQTYSGKISQSMDLIHPGRI